MSTIKNHINTYADLTAYNNDMGKDYPNVSYIEEDDIVLFEGIRYEEQYFTIESLEDDNAVKFKLSATTGTPSASSAKTISVSTDDGKTWTDYTSTANGTTIATLNMGEKVLIKGNNDTYYTRGSGSWDSGNYFNCFTASNQIDINGNIMSLIYGDNFKEQYSFPSGTTNNFYSMFENSPVVSAENLVLPATTLANACYANMFNGCTSLTTAPKLPATTLASNCYNWMFANTNVLPDCSNIDFTSETVVSSGGLKGLFSGTKVTDSDLDRLLPKNANGKYCLPATTLTDSCYYSMFYGCTSLTTAPVLPATTLAQSCYYEMFYGCTSLTTAPVLPATTLAQSCYDEMFYGCTSLTTAPELPATTLAQSCCSSMFCGCTSLTTAPQLPATTIASGCYQNMFNGCTSLITAPKLPATTLANNCYAHMFMGCTSLTTAPALSATALAQSCYSSMFDGCTSLTTAPQLPATTLAQSCCSSMFRNCTSLTTAPALSARTLVKNCYYYMFYGCKNLNYIKAMFTTKPSTIYTSNWVSGVAASGTFVKNSAATWNVTGVNGVPSDWTIQKASS